MASSLEHLRRARRLAAAARHDAGVNPAVLVRAWPYLTTAAHETYRTIPEPSDPGRHVERIAIAGHGLHEANLRHPSWPGEGGLDPALGQVIKALGDVVEANDLTRDQSHEAERAVSEILWTSAHAAAGPVRDHLQDLNRTLSKSVGANRILLEGRRLTHDAFGRLTAAENLAANSIASRTIASSSPATSLVDAVATWDVEAQRTLLTNRSTAALALVARNETSIQRAFTHAVDHAAQTGVLDRHTAERLSPVLETLSEEWDNLANSTRELLYGAQAVRRETHDAAEQLRTAFQSTRLDNESPTNQAAVLGALNSHLSSSLALAASARELTHSGELVAPARAIHELLKRDLEHSPMTAPVNPADVIAGRSIPLPPAARASLNGAVEAVYLESEEAVARGAGLDELHRDPAAQSSPTEAPRTTRQIPPPGFGLNPRPLTPPL